MTLPKDGHRVKPHTGYEGTVVGYFCIDCDKWVAKEHAENILCGRET